MQRVQGESFFKMSEKCEGLLKGGLLLAQAGHNDAA